MTTLKNAIIITHRVLHPEGAGAPSAYTYTAKSVHKYLDYAAREGRFEERGGCDEHLTRADIALELKREASVSIHDMLEYGNRSGRFAGRGEEMPLSAGEVSGGIWDANGVRKLEDVEREILASKSNVVQSVFAVSREWAQILGMDTKEAWQDIMRSKWNEFMGEWGVIPEKDRRWVAEYHVDGKMSLHVHVMSWDASGKSFTGSEGIPHEVIESSKRSIREEVMKEIRLERSLEKDFVRQAALVLAKGALGLKIDETEIGKVQAKADALGAPFEPGRFRGDGAALGAQMGRVVESLPASGIGRDGYASQTLDTKAQANLAVNILKTDPDISRMSGAWRDLVARGADIIGLSGRERERYIAKEERDLDARLANLVLKRAAAENKPWERNRALKECRSHVARLALDGVTIEERAGLSRTRDRESARFRAISELKSERCRDEASRYLGEVLLFVRENTDRALTKQQEMRVVERARQDLIAYASWQLARTPTDGELSRNLQEVKRTQDAMDRPYVRRELEQRRDTSLFLDDDEMRLLKDTIGKMAERLQQGESRENIRPLAEDCITMLASTSTLQSSLARSIDLNREALGPDGPEKLSLHQRDLIFQEMVRAARDEGFQVEIEDVREMTAAQDSLLDSFMKQLPRRVSVRHVSLGPDGTELEVRLKRSHALDDSMQRAR